MQRFGIGNYFFSYEVFELYPIYTKQVILDGLEEEMRTINVNCSISKRPHFAVGKKICIFRKSHKPHC